MLRCSDDTLYTGITNNLEKRIRDHNQGKGAKYTKGRSPVKVVFQETCETKSEALRREIALKKLTRDQKKRLIYGVKGVDIVE